MTYKDIGFRGVYHQFIAIDIDKTIGKICKSYPNFDKANCVLVYGYIDHTAGTTLELLDCGHRDKDSFVFYDSPTDKRDIIRIGAVDESELYVIDDTNDKLYHRYAQRLEVLQVFSIDESLERTRSMGFLDSSRHPHFPDDIQLYLQTDSGEFEVCWVRIEGADEKTLYGKLLNEPFKPSKCHEGDIIEFSLFKTEDGKLVCVSNGTKRQLDPANENELKTAIMRFNNDKTNENLISIMELLRDILIWIPCNAVISDTDIEKLKSAKAGMTFQSTDDIRMIPDILQNGDEYFFSVFTSAAEMGEYGDNFSKIEKWFLEAIPLAFNNEKKVSGIVINAFTEPFVVPNDLLKIIQEQGSHYKMKEQ